MQGLRLRARLADTHRQEGKEALPHSLDRGWRPMSTARSRPIYDANAATAARPPPLITSAHLSVTKHILRTDFGAVVEKVCVHMLIHGAATLAEVARSIEGIMPSQLRNAVLVLR